MSTKIAWMTNAGLGVVLAACLIVPATPLAAHAGPASAAGQGAVAALTAPVGVDADVFGVVDFPDAAVRAAVEQALDGAPATPENLAALERGPHGPLHIDGAMSLEGLQHLTSLRALALTGGDLSAPDALAPLAGMTSLEQLSIQGAGVTAVGGIRSLTGLNSLDLSGNRLHSLEGLGELRLLEQLRLDGNGLRNGTPGFAELGALTELRHVELSENELTSLLTLFGDDALARERLIDWIAVVHTNRQGAANYQGISLTGQFSATGATRSLDDVDQVIALLQERGIVPGDYGPLFFDPPGDAQPPIVPEDPGVAPGPEVPAPEVPAPEVPAPEVPAPEVPAPEVPAPEVPGEDAGTVTASDAPGSAGGDADVLDAEMELDDPPAEDADADAGVERDGSVGEASAVSAPTRWLGAGLVLASALAAGLGIWFFALLRRRRREDEGASEA